MYRMCTHDRKIMQIFMLALGLLLLSLKSTRVSAEVSELKLVRSDICATQLGDNIITTQRARSLLDCVAKCRHEPLCDVISFCKNSTGSHCVMLQRGSDVIPSAAGQNPCSCYEKRCFNGGEELAGGKCKCTGGYVGSRCEKLTADCEELIVANSSAYDDVFLVWPPTAPRPFKVHCAFSGRTVMMRRMTAAENFNRTWTDYAEGFGSLDAWTGDVWRGLRYWHYLTSSRTFKLQVFITTRDGTEYRRLFHDFSVGDESSGFRMTFSGSSSRPMDLSPGDSLSSGIGNRFSTYDRDNDLTAYINCAQLHGGGWWFSNCGDSNPTGPLLRPPGGLRQGIPGEAFWTNNLGNTAVWQIRFNLVY